MLFYEYVEDAVEKRQPFRADHLHLVEEHADIVMGGALGDPPHGAAIIFATDDPAVAERFAERDPYVTGGVVTSWRLERYAVVTD